MRSRGCELRDMGTHPRAPPAGEHCSRGLVSLRCSRAYSRRCAAPTVWARARTPRALTSAGAGPSGAGRPDRVHELEMQRTDGALRRAQELPYDVAAAIESAA
jgi:hypothetical protein